MCAEVRAAAQHPQHLVQVKVLAVCQLRRTAAGPSQHVQARARLPQAWLGSPATERHAEERVVCQVRCKRHITCPTWLRAGAQDISQACQSAAPGDGLQFSQQQAGPSSVSPINITTCAYTRTITQLPTRAAVLPPMRRPAHLATLRPVRGLPRILHHFAPARARPLLSCKSWRPKHTKALGTLSFYREGYETPWQSKSNCNCQAKAV